METIKEGEGKGDNEDQETQPSSFNAKWANERLESLLGYGRFQVFQVWVFLGLVGFLGAMNMFHLMFSITKKPHRCALPEPLEKRLEFKYWYGHIEHFA